MTPDDQSQFDAETLLRGTQRRQRWLRDARRFHTKNLFGFWFLLVLGVCVLIFATLIREQFSLLLPVSLLLMFLVVLTGAYVFQEVARVHKRVDAILKLLEEEERE